MREVGWEALNAYADGELDREASARIAAAVAADPSLARQVATIARLKAAVHAGLEPVEARRIMPRVPVARRMRALALAASVALMIALSAVLASSRFAPPAGDPAPDWLARAVAAHEAWLGGDRFDGLGAGALLVGYRSLRLEAPVPDLSAARLELAGVRFHPGARERGPALQIGYRGSRGCRLTLWIAGAPPAAADRPPEVRSLGALRAVLWSARGRAFALISGMPEERLRGLAAAIAEIFERRAAPDPAMRSALRTARDASPPCPA